MVSFHWDGVEARGLSLEGCSRCLGLGTVTVRGGEHSRPCGCVLRAVFNICLRRFRYCLCHQGSVRSVTLDHVGGGSKSSRCWGMRDQEYVADFVAVSRRALDPSGWRMFRFHFLLGAGWRLCCRRLGMDRGSFFHALYRMEHKLGRVYRELRPYPLFPLDEYFGGTVGGRPLSWHGNSDAGIGPAPVRVLRPPLKAA
jgi:hypothetical protein